MSELSVCMFLGDDTHTPDLVRSFEELNIRIEHVSDVDSWLEQLNGISFSFAVVDALGENIDGRIDSVRRIAESESFDWIIVLIDQDTKGRVIDEIGSTKARYLHVPVDARELTSLVRGMTEMTDLRTEVSSTARRLSHLEVLNHIASQTLHSQGDQSLLWNIARLINDRLGFYNVNMFLVDDDTERVVLQAFAGGFGNDLVVGYSLQLGEGIVGWVARNQEHLLANDVSAEPRRLRGFSFEKQVRSELAVPVIFSDRTLGVIHVESEELGAFSEEDVMLLETIADQLSLTLENHKLSAELRNMYELSTTITDSLPVSIIIIDSDFTIAYVNRTYLDASRQNRKNIQGQPVLSVISPDLIERLQLEQQFATVIERGIPAVFPNIYHSSPNHPDRVLTITIERVQSGNNPLVMLFMQDVTAFSEKSQQLMLLREISIAMQGVFERDRLLNMILTNVTAGFAIGFNRAFLFLVNKRKNTIDGIMAAGPTTRDEAYRIWDELSRHPFTFHDYLDHVNTGTIARSGLQSVVEDISFDLSRDRNVLTETVTTASHMHITDAWDNPDIDTAMKLLLASNEFVTIPLIAKNEVIGVLFADNAYSGKPITDESIEKLTLFAMAAAIAIENADMLTVLEEKVQELEEAYSKLEKTHAMLVRHEKLAAIGEVSARLAHEIRNPLATIGGFAKSIPRKYEDRDRTIRNARIIIDEVERLEGILANVLDFTKSSIPHKERIDINDLVRDTVSIMEEGARKTGIGVETSIIAGSLQSDIDPAQVKQVLINILQNAVSSMPQGGTLTVGTGREDGFARIVLTDTGTGIPEEHLETIFDPFFTTRGDGTGLGLPISQQIIHNHDGSLEIESIVGEGTTVTISLPVISVPSRRAEGGVQ
jgi:PAS domain S-box-containing protein